MAVRRVETADEAADEVREAYDWYLERNPKAASRLLGSLHRAYEKITQFPNMGPVWTGGRTSSPVRTIRLGDFPYSLVYRVDGERIRIIALAHASRLPGYWAERR